MKITQHAIHDLARHAIVHGGVTAHSDGKIIESYDGWVFPRYPDNSSKVPEKRLESALAEFIKQNADLLTGNELIGIWRNGSEYYIDINVQAVTFAEAKQIAQSFDSASKRSIISAYNPARGETKFFNDEEK